MLRPWTRSKNFAERVEEIRAKLAPGTSVEVWFQDEMRDCEGGSPRVRPTTARIPFAWRRCGCVAGRGACAAASDAGDRVSPQPVTPAVRFPDRCVSQRAK